MAKDAKGHGSEKRGEVGELGSQHSSNAVMARLAAARSNPNHPLGALTRAVSQGTPIAGIPAAEAGELGSAHSSNSGEAHVAGIAAQHGVSTVHLTGTGNAHIWPGQMRGGQKVSYAEHQYNRDLALRARNGQVGSGMKFRG